MDHLPGFARTLWKIKVCHCALTIGSDKTDLLAAPLLCFLDSQLPADPAVFDHIRNTRSQPLKLFSLDGV